jgi:hypothetical protein
VAMRLPEAVLAPSRRPTRPSSAPRWTRSSASRTT